MDIIEQLRKDTNSLGDVYTAHRDYCINFMRRMHNDMEALRDIYQDAIIVLYENAQKRDFTLTCSVQTYLNSICRNQLLNRFRKDAKQLNFSEDYLPEVNDWFEDLDCEDDDRLNAMEKALRYLKETSKNCFQLLQAFYYRKLSMKEIALEFDYTNEQNARNQKARCKKRLKVKSMELYLGQK